MSIGLWGDLCSINLEVFSVVLRKQVKEEGKMTTELTLKEKDMNHLSLLAYLLNSKPDDILMHIMAFEHVLKETRPSSSLLPALSEMAKGFEAQLSINAVVNGFLQSENQNTTVAGKKLRAILKNPTLARANEEELLKFLREVTVTKEVPKKEEKRQIQPAEQCDMCRYRDISQCNQPICRMEPRSRGYFALCRGFNQRNDCRNFRLP